MTPTRRAFLAATATAAALPALPQTLDFTHGPTNGPANKILLRHRNEALALITHARRDLIPATINPNTTHLIPATEAEPFTNPQPFWQALYATTRLHDYANQSTRLPITPLPNAKPVAARSTFTWNGIPIEVLPTPGYTRGAVSYAFTLEGKRYIASGALILDQSKIPDLHSFQDAIPELRVRGYHGYAARLSQHIASLRLLAARNPDILLPSQGPAITNPAQQIATLIERLQALYANYLRTDAYRWYFGAENYQARAARILGTQPVPVPQMSESIVETLPPWLKKIDNARLVVSQSGEAILIDCGSRRILDQVRAWQNEGVFKTLRAIYITHYHDDHTDFAQAAAEAFNAEVWSSAEQQEILRHPARFRMPCLTPNPISSLHPWRDRETRDWQEFRLTNFHFPGQTLYHGTLRVEPKTPNQPALFFIGDSFTPSGVDDYCLLNRNFLAPNQGLLYCLNILEEFPETMLINQHVNPLFRFSKSQLTELKLHLNARIPILESLSPDGNANNLIDEQWCRLSPYVQPAKASQRLEIEAVIRNHNATPKSFTLQLHPPPTWKVPRAVSIIIPPHQESRIAIPVQVPATASGLQVLTASIKNTHQHLAEALIDVAV